MSTENSPLLYNPFQNYSAIEEGNSPSIILTKEIYPKIAASFHPTMDRIKEIIHGDLSFFNQVYDNHRLHDLVIKVTLEVRKDLKVKALWESFITTLHKKIVSCPGGKWILLDFAPELSLLKNPDSLPTQNQIKVERLNLLSKNLDRILLQIDEISRESFAITERRTPADLTSMIADPKVGVFIAVDGVTHDILGNVIVCDESQKKLRHHITSFARKANAAKRGIANILLKHIFENHIPRQSTTFLEVRKSNEIAIELYKKFRFKIEKQKPSYYCDPDESAYDMVRQPEDSGSCTCLIQ